MVLRGKQKVGLGNGHRPLKTPTTFMQTNLQIRDKGKHTNIAFTTNKNINQHSGYVATVSSKRCH